MSYSVKKRKRKNYLKSTSNIITHQNYKWYHNPAQNKVVIDGLDGLDGWMNRWIGWTGWMDRLDGWMNRWTGWTYWMDGWLRNSAPFSNMWILLCT